MKYSLLGPQISHASPPMHALARFRPTFDGTYACIDIDLVNLSLIRPTFYWTGNDILLLCFTKT